MDGQEATPRRSPVVCRPRLRLFLRRDHLRQGRVLRWMKIEPAPGSEEIPFRGPGIQIREHRIQEDARYYMN